MEVNEATRAAPAHAHAERRAPVALSAAEALANTKLFPYWLDNPAAPATEPELVGDATADLLIVGGGFTGLWAAVQAKEQMPHLNVVLIEAGKVAHGASGRAGGIISTSVMHGLPNAVRVFPNDIAQLEAFGHRNLDGFEETLKRYDIDADIEWNGEMTVAVDPEHLAHLKGDYDLHREYGHDVVLLNRDETLEQLNSPLFAGALWSRNRSGIVHPAKLAWGLKRAALSLGVMMAETNEKRAASAMRRLSDMVDHWNLNTRSGWEMVLNYGIAQYAIGASAAELLMAAEQQLVRQQAKAASKPAPLTAVAGAVK